MQTHVVITAILCTVVGSAVAAERGIPRNSSVPLIWPLSDWNVLCGHRHAHLMRSIRQN